MVNELLKGAQIQFIAFLILVEDLSIVIFFG